MSSSLSFPPIPDPRDFPDTLPGGHLYRDALAAWERVALALVARVEVQAVPKAPLGPLAAALQEPPSECGPGCGCESQEGGPL